MTDLYLGIDLGTSGIRCAVVDANRTVIAMTRGTYRDTSALGWWHAVSEGLRHLHREIGDNAMRRITCTAVDGTSGTMVLVDAALAPVTEPLMYNSNGFDAEAALIAPHAPKGDITIGPSSALARLLHLQSMDHAGRGVYMCHQADFILAKLRGTGGASDENNSLKTGYDPVLCVWPDWLEQTGLRCHLLPDVYPVGTPVGTVHDHVAEQFGFSASMILKVGTTDSIAAFLATGANKVGEAVTSLGTTLAIKLMSDTRIEDVAHGVYSHKVGNHWLVGGASNSGGGALLAHFSLEEIDALSMQVNPDKALNLGYYPLLGTGERFPHNDPAQRSVTSPRPPEDHLFLQALLEGIAGVEAQCYRLLGDLGAPAPCAIWTAGGGGKSDVWTQIRKRIVSGNIRTAPHTEAAIGTAMLCIDT